MNELTSSASLSLPKAVVNNVLPSILLSSDLSMSYSMNDSQFYVTYVQETFQFYYYIFGVVVVSLCLLYGFCRATCLSLYSRNS
jgi:hypothetical protein